MVVRQPLLLVDADPVAAAASEALLMQNGYDVAREARGDVVLQLVRTLYMRLVVTELRVPCVAGPCVATVLAGMRSRFPRLRIVILTRRRTAADRAWAIAAGADAIVDDLSPAPPLLHALARFGEPRRHLSPRAHT